jgi:DnaJ family protein B protein 4
LLTSNAAQKEHPLFTRDWGDLYLTLELSLIDSLCGFKRTVTTIDGKMIAIEKVGLTEPESKDTYPGLGMPNSKKPDQRGHFIVKYKVRYPLTLTKSQQMQLRQVLGGSTTA